MGRKIWSWLELSFHVTADIYKDTNICMLVLLFSHWRTWVKIREPLLHRGLHPRPHRPGSSRGLASGRFNWLLGRPQSSAGGQGSSGSGIPGSWGGVDWQSGNTNRPGSNLHPSGIVGVKDYIQSGSIGHQWTHAVDTVWAHVSLCLSKCITRLQNVS